MHDVGCCLGFDYGLKKIGIAIGQFVTLTAQPLSFIKVKDGHPDWSALEKLLKEWRPKCLVVGLPKSIHDEPLSITEHVLNFARDLERFHLPVYFSDERMTTKEARQALFDAGGFRALNYGKVDSVAAAIILEQWMNEAS
jgi:putative Holliday junction resolvase